MRSSRRGTSTSAPSSEKRFAPRNRVPTNCSNIPACSAFSSSFRFTSAASVRRLRVRSIRLSSQRAQLPIADVAELDPERAAIGLLEAVDELAQGRRGAPEPGHLPVQVGRREPELRELQPLGAAGGEPQRVQVGLEVAVLSPGANQPIGLQLEGLAGRCPVRDRVAVALAPRRPGHRGGRRVPDRRQLLEVGPPPLVDRGRILQPGEVEVLDEAQVGGARRGDGCVAVPLHDPGIIMAAGAGALVLLAGAVHCT